MKDQDTLEQTLRQAQAQRAWLQAQAAPRQDAESRGRELLGTLTRRRQRAQQQGVPMWEGAQRAALRMVVLGLGCIALITGASALDGTAGGVAIVISLGVLGLEGLR